MDIKFTEENLIKLEGIKSRYPNSHAALLPALWIAQEQFGWLSKEIMEYVGALLDVPFEHILGVVRFYTMYNSKPVGKYHLQVCTNVSCMLKGGYETLNYISKKLGINPGETTGDGLFTVTEVECLGSCGTAPMMQVNNYFEENLSEEKIDKLITEMSNSLHKS